MKPIALIVLAALWTHAAVAQEAAPLAVIVDAASLAAAVERKAVVWDVRPADAFAKGHIPGAVNIGAAAAVLRDPNSEDFVSTARIEQLLGAAGIDPQREVVVYGNRGGWQACFGLYTLQYFGAKRARVYHEGIEDWSAAGRGLAQGAGSNVAVALKLSPDGASTVSVSTSEMIARLNRSDVQIVDARTEREFRGEDIRALRGGHIPGAVNIPYERNWIDPETANKLARREVSSNAGMSLKSVESLKALYAGLDTEKETIVYCQSGARASETAGVLQQLGFKKVKVYDSSWLGYGNTLAAPAANESFFNVGLLNSKLSTLQRRIEQLEKELAAAKGGK